MAGRLLSLAGLAAWLVCCAGQSTGDNGLLIDERVVSTSDTHRGCPMYEILTPLGGTITIDLTDAERVWLVDASGGRLSLRWPKGFGLRSDPQPVVVDQQGREVARDGSSIAFPQMDRGAAKGTSDDPYILYGPIGSDCYAPIVKLD